RRTSRSTDRIGDCRFVNGDWKAPLTRRHEAAPRARLSIVNHQSAISNSSRLTHPHKAAVVLAGQGPQEGAEVGALVEEPDRVDAHPLAADQPAVPVGLQLRPQEP